MPKPSIMNRNTNTSSSGLTQKLLSKTSYVNFKENQNVMKRRTDATRYDGTFIADKNSGNIFTPCLQVPVIVQPPQEEDIYIPLASGGFSLSTYIDDYPINLYPAVNIAYQNEDFGGEFIIQTTSAYSVPNGYTFLNNWYFNTYDSNNITVSEDKLTATANYGAFHSVYGNVAISSGSLIMFSVQHSIYNGIPTNDAVGIGTLNISNSIGINNTSIAFYDDGSEFAKGNEVLTGLTSFQENGQIIDVAVDTFNNLVWYRINGGAWQG